MVRVLPKNKTTANQSRAENSSQKQQNTTVEVRHKEDTQHIQEEEAIEIDLTATSAVATQHIEEIVINTSPVTKDTIEKDMTKTSPAAKQIIKKDVTETPTAVNEHIQTDVTATSTAEKEIKSRKTSEEDETFTDILSTAINSTILSQLTDEEKESLNQTETENITYDGQSINTVSQDTSECEVQMEAMDLSCKSNNLIGDVVNLQDDKQNPVTEEGQTFSLEAAETYLYSVEKYTVSFIERNMDTQVQHSAEETPKPNVRTVVKGPEDDDLSGNEEQDEQSRAIQYLEEEAVEISSELPCSEPSNLPKEDHAYFKSTESRTSNNTSKIRQEETLEVEGKTEENYVAEINDENISWTYQEDQNIEIDHQITEKSEEKAGNKCYNDLQLAKEVERDTQEHTIEVSKMPDELSDNTQSNKINQGKQKQLSEADENTTHKDQWQISNTPEEDIVVTKGTKEVNSEIDIKAVASQEAESSSEEDIIDVIGLSDEEEENSCQRTYPRPYIRKKNVKTVNDEVVPEAKSVHKPPEENAVQCETSSEKSTSQQEQKSKLRKSVKILWRRENQKRKKSADCKEDWIDKANQVINDSLPDLKQSPDRQSLEIKSKDNNTEDMDKFLREHYEKANKNRKKSKAARAAKSAVTFLTVPGTEITHLLHWQQ